MVPKGQHILQAKTDSKKWSLGVSSDSISDDWGQGVGYVASYGF